MRLQNPFASLSTAGLDSQVLTVLARSNQYLTIQQIHQLLPETGSLAGVRHPISRLVAQGTVLERVTGRTSGYALNKDHLLIEPILQIANAKKTLIERISETITSWSHQPLTVQLFGSAARNDMETESDIDILFVFDESTDDQETDTNINHLTQQVSRWTGNDVRPLVYSESEVEPAPIFDSVLREGIPISGNPNWLRRHIRRSRQSA